MAPPTGFDLIVTFVTVFMLVSTLLALWTLVFLRHRAHSIHYHCSPSRRRGLRSDGFVHEEGSVDPFSISLSCPFTLRSNISTGDVPVFHVILTPPTPAKEASTDDYEYSDDKLSHVQSAPPYLP
ncbi:hypothetical protein PAXINDRAFT_10162 [Paxillus involutus ATCC 200175]|nr:hypothetical protein PAXINDRAFT_10162 [Paxillus involutus ATCC 200175]